LENGYIRQYEIAIDHLCLSVTCHTADWRHEMQCSH
jgi:hypothetical protein